ncbi:MAG: tetraacyldisaccharide 4'-kinase [Sedimentisphaerales bacterium]|nr:tetraacyldisaccharide 4'-kinase [Sedimentisphaerales bacterium]
MDSVFWRKLVLCEDPTLGQKLLRVALSVFAFFYGIAIALRNFFYNYSILKSKKVASAVISIGNITVGGTGKTPLVAWLSNYFAEKNISTAILTRGYKMKASHQADEPMLLAKSCPGAKVVINPDRLAGAQRAMAEYDAKLLIMDDGFQHRRLARDVDIVTIDATQPFGRDKLLPAGLLRESVNSLKRADAVVITRSDQVQQIKIDQIKDRILQINPNMVFAAAIHKPRCIKLIKDETLALDVLKDRKIYAFCGIGNPPAFFQTLDELALNIVGTKVYNDHHRYTASDIEAIASDSRYKQADMIVTTQKDWIKTALLYMDKFDIPFAFLAVEIEFVTGRQEIMTLIEPVLEKK